MKTNSTNPVQALLALVLFSSFSFAQTGVPFKMRYQSTIKGDMTVIANGSALTPYNKIDNAMLNDEFEMSYIDIDSDETTFSSSSATLELANSQNKKVVYAGLYWSATYKFNPGVIKQEEEFVEVPNKREAIKYVKIKLPNQGECTDVVGEVIFDGNKSKTYKENESRSETNFFNSSITNENGEFSNRVPNSKNTLGYDSFVMTIPNADNANLDNNASEAMLKFNSTGDRTYVFFTAFNVQVGDSNSMIVSAEPTEKIDFKNETVADAYQTNMMVTTMTEKYEVASVDKNVQIQTQSIPNQKSGYYVVANVFSDPYFAKEFIKTLKSQGVEADYFVNSENGFRDVYVTKSANEQDAVSQYLALADTKYQGKTWVLSVNNKESFTSKTMLASEE